MLIAAVIILFLASICQGNLREHQCRDPDVGGTAQNQHRKFILFGSPEPSSGAGIGNILIFFPAMYYFAAFTGRDIIISDKSMVGEMCRIITCGFPFASEMSLAFPNILGKDSLKKAELIKVQDFIKYIENTREISGNLVYPFGYKSESAWWQYFNSTIQCVSKITGCEPGDIACADRHAFQRLIRGPFKTSLTADEEKRIYGVPDHIKHAILTLPHAFAPRLDAAVHLRNSFHHFESQTDITDPAYRKEVNDWLNSSECASVFHDLAYKLLEQIGESRLAVNATRDDAVYVYVAADNEDVKDAFAAYINSNSNTTDSNSSSSNSNSDNGSSTNSLFPFPVNVMRVESKFIVHIKV